MQPEPIEREIKLKEILTIASGAMMTLYIMFFQYLGKSLFELTTLGYALIFCPLWLLASSTVVSAAGVIDSKKRIKARPLLLLFSLAVFSVPLSITLVYLFPKVFWSQ